MVKKTTAKGKLVGKAISAPKEKGVKPKIPKVKVKLTSEGKGQKEEPEKTSKDPVDE